MDAALTAVIEGVVDDKIQNGDMFTAYDVTVEVRNRGHNERHNNIKSVVHDYFERGQMGSDYTRTLVPIAGAPIPPWVYHRNTDDPTTYNPRSGKAKPNPAAVKAQVAGFYAQGQASTDPDDDDDDDGSNNSVPASLPVSVPAVAVNGSRHRASGHVSGCVPDARGTVCVPADLLRAAGFKPKDTAHIWQHVGGSLRVCKAAAGGTPLAAYTVDENNNVRITKHVLQNIGPASSYEFKGDTSEVLVTAK